MKQNFRVLLAMLVIGLFVSVALASVVVPVNGTNYTIPQTNEKGWGTNVTSWIQAISANTLQPSGGTFTLGADVDFGASFGLKTAYVKSRAANISTAGILRLGNTDAIGWRNAANTANLLLSVDTSGNLNYNGVPLLSPSALTPSRAMATDTNGIISTSAVTSTELGRLSGVLSSVAGISDTATFTNKTISGASNTLSNISLTSSVTGVLPIANGGTSGATKAAGFDALSPNSTLGDITFYNGSTNARLAGNTTATKQFLIQTGTGTVSASPVWGSIAAADVPTLNQNTTGNAATATTATNVSGVVAIANGGSGQTTANTALNAFLPSQSTAAGQFLKSDGTNTSWSNPTIALKAPTFQIFTSGSGTYTKPTSPAPLYIKVKLLGAGGGAGGSGTSGATAGGNGGNTTFGALTAGGGSGTNPSTNAAITNVGGSGGTASGGNILNVPGAQGEGAGFVSGASAANNDIAGGSGGNSILGFGGTSAGGGVGISALANSGGGGGGPGNNNTCYAVAGGGGGGYIEHIYSTPAATYSYAVGAGGTAGAAGTSGLGGGAGGSGIIIVEEFYQ